MLDREILVFTLAGSESKSGSISTRWFHIHECGHSKAQRRWFL